MRRSTVFFALACALAFAGAWAYTPVRHDGSYTTNGVTYAQRGGLGSADYVVTNIDTSAVGKVQSVNGKDGVVTLDYSDVSALPDDQTLLLGNANFSNAVVSVSPPVELPQKWALADVTNEAGVAVSAVDVGAATAEQGAKADTAVQPADLDPLLFAQYYPEGNVKSAAEFTSGIRYDAPDTTNRTITVKPFCYTDIPEGDNSGLEGRVVIPPFVDAQGNPYIYNDGTRYKVIGVGNGDAWGAGGNLTAIVAPNTVKTIGDNAFYSCPFLSSVSIPAATSIGGSFGSAFFDCNALTSVSLPAATVIGTGALGHCDALKSVYIPSATRIWDGAFADSYELAYVDFGGTPRPSVPPLGNGAFSEVPTTCKIIVPDAQYAAWTAASGWNNLVARGYKFLRHSEWEYARRYEIQEADFVTSVNGKTGTVVLAASDIGALGRTGEQSMNGGRLDVWGVRPDLEPLFRAGNSENTYWVGLSREHICRREYNQNYDYFLQDASGTLAFTSDIPPAVSNVVTKAYVDNLGIALAETDPVWSAEKGNYATKTALETGAITVYEAENAVSAQTAYSADYAALAEGLRDGPTEIYAGAIFAQINAATTTNAQQTVAISTLSTNVYTKSETEAAIENIVTTAYVREKLGVYLYVGEDGGIYVHTNEE